MKTSLTLLGLPLLLLAGESFASLRCEKGIASEGDRMVEVQSKCGMPTSQNVIAYSKTRTGNRSEEVEVQEWVYGPQSGGMLYFLRFEGGVLKRIESKRGN
ncbi:DUF2845 domain-containing protein [Pseudomonas sp. 2FE]|uniref:DUF2845 domain-containing protein n=1 Tax=Pseudomonas sp. 2FE TaxID=2502190 RepID=UPI0010F4F0AB|nr:DUF2845 domain-containing protein [Pseudomonas sp. 2FE]